MRAGIAALACCALANCSSSPGYLAKLDPRLGVSSSPRVVEPGQPIPKGGGHYQVGAPYVVGGRTYVPTNDPHYRAEGLASWYGEDFHGRLTANGEVYDMHGISAAHPTLPLPCYARVTNLKNGRSIIVRVNDRGPYHSNRLIDLSTKAAHLLDFYGDGLAPVRVEYVSPAPLEGTDDNVLLATLRVGSPAPSPSPILLASSRPFLPSSFGTRVAARGGVPMPQDRPYNLGEDQGSSIAEPTPGTNMAAARTRQRATPSFDDRIAANRVPPVIAETPRNSLQNPSPIAAYAAPQASPSIMTGRGLY
ncbi:MAG TPA: septal ring lytic transglycosylase RlpA family protein [Xanthobacteraceae bacterium]|nr:septal ring lytic transglycosylase RlpA family protein [Xanthobacteraceae bacterium]